MDLPVPMQALPSPAAGLGGHATTALAAPPGRGSIQGEGTTSEGTEPTLPDAGFASMLIGAGSPVPPSGPGLAVGPILSRAPMARAEPNEIGEASIANVAQGVPLTVPSNADPASGSTNGSVEPEPSGAHRDPLASPERSARAEPLGSRPSARPSPPPTGAVDPAHAGPPGHAPRAGASETHAFSDAHPLGFASPGVERTDVTATPAGRSTTFGPVSPPRTSSPHALRDSSTAVPGPMVDHPGPEPLPEGVDVPGSEPTAPRSAAEAPRPAFASVTEGLRRVRLAEGRTRIELSPRELGDLQIDLRHDPSGRLTVVLRVENPAVLSAMRGDRDALLATLREGGVSVDLSDLSFESFGGHHAARDAWGERQAPVGRPPSGAPDPIPSDPRPPRTAALVANLDIFT
ncbi:flagellar hook-length control protein FliK [Jannaschia sp. Os4]|uniref:flagellar hook-length control protein FliK n=1 Tax=Jannaschia sp. Os4 TaxID=2807617 RepID=UPI00193AB7B2|nr:flagellar hook-length control protein FliK [Jannaschia sp. Os4]MBM2575690.1 flagellar hook-length control protein FliK [Jannaschia sp. Os4]